MATTRIKCVNPKGYKVTKDKEYPVVAVEEGYYKLYNDNNKLVRYAMDLFEATEKKPGPQPREARVVPEPVAPPPPPPRTRQDVIASIIAEGNTIVFENINRERVVLSNPMSYTGTHISCGIHQVTGIDSLCSAVDDCFDLEQDDHVEERKALMRAAIQNFIIDGVADTDCAMRICSTVVEDESNEDNEEGMDPDYQRIFDEMATSSTTTVINPNSDNSIKMWVFYTGDE